MNTIAVLLPVYKKDAPNFLTSTIASLLNQTQQDFKIFLRANWTWPLKGASGVLNSVYADLLRIGDWLVYSMT